jgi:molybdate transport system substrate-binding protein
VAANFAEVVEELRPGFEASGHALRVTSGSTGMLYAQIRQGAPFDVFLAADSHRPTLLEQARVAVTGSRFTYARGRLTLWSSDRARRVTGPAVLAAGDYRRLAIANPQLAPYGAATLQVLAALGLEEAVAGRIVMGENVGQAYALVATGNAELGFVARSQLAGRPGTPGDRWPVRSELHDPIAQDAVLLIRAADNAAAREFLEFLRGPVARGAIRRHGYEAH